MKGILLDENNEITINVVRDIDIDGIITHGMVIGNVDEQVMKEVIIAHPGDVREMPALGCYANAANNGKLSSKFCGIAVKQLKSQHLTAKVNITNGELIVNI